ncbi:iron-containing alcohol dehydrogenase family protein [uncultured Megasphaera sp.]|uniref:iron-containing alcohol dehydrogenase family protein n=1 Tax=uncultured Megasphaera sp. TaxID=165188 RepID=UPI0026598668|nr:iron-containing alcohol dehydrogenase family protein [uncultured Megasphaera sp.]
MFQYEMPTKVYFGKDCIAQSGDVLAQFGRKALLVTGRHSAKINGAQQAVTDKLDALGIEWVLFDEVESNPSIETVRRAAEVGRNEQVGCVIAIGGGSPMDAGKVIALLCTNDLDDTALFTGPYCPPLPIIAVPTTSGTGSEVTKVAVLTNPHAGTKQSVGSPLIFPKIAFVDPTFTVGVSRRVTIDTAIDALSHAVEGYLSTGSTPMSDVWAEEAMRFLGIHLDALDQELSYAVREDLMYASTLAGIVIAQTGTTLIHGMGYQLTYYKGLSHGRANGILFPAYMKLMEEAVPDKTAKIWELLDVSGLEEFTEIMKKLMPGTVDLTEEEIELYTKLTMPTSAVKRTSCEVTPDLVKQIYRSLKA